ncbi:hypothetical protein Saut_0074 [Sulfurimonas autotrophica DSM 16294]|uniref:DUF309 domain-containing protein n=1 Tax=Sulfurimonas autotrophica (strain ATCC BAA-671 / DSM 16294 / JCM 11897 / OK10) TaxID=563040 RepID=E0USU6_SULAO|nr:hypothetical protein Saut_0074 [Sulfurimonas autotrophica DSM 16294]
MHKHIQKFTKCLNEERFYDAHEALEEAWFPRRFEDDKEVKLLKGFINASVSFELLKRGREQQSKKVWANYLKYRPYIFEIDSAYQNSYYQLSRLIEQRRFSIFLSFTAIKSKNAPNAIRLDVKNKYFG